jgi:single-stranded-DNA-specific exonuclease
VAPEPANARDLQRSLGCSRIAAILLAQRGVETGAQAREFLSPSFEALADPTLLPDATKAVRRLMVALDHHERIYVYGDYDADGITAAALWTRLLQQLGGDVCTHVPHRRRDGYDLRNKVVKAARDVGAKLIVTADCGIQRHEEVQTAKRLGLDVIVTDHHEVGETLPGAVAVVNPHRSDSQYPFRDLAGVGVSYRLAEALVRAVGLPVDKYRRAFSDLAAIGTVTDIMPLLGDNRVFVRTGLRRMSETQRKGLRALMRIAGIEGRPVTSHDIGFAIGPRLNAVGRVDEPQKALDLLLSRVEAEAVGLAEQLESANQSRKDEEQRILGLATAAISTLDLERCPCLVLDGQDWHPGVIGVVANRLVERYGRPTVLIATDPDTGVGRGSARSIPSFNIHDALLECGNHFIEFGGHSHAAGFTIPTGNVGSFRDELVRYAAGRLRADELQPCIEVDAEVSLREITLGLLAELELFEPWGHDNEEPLFATFNVRIVEAWRIGRDGFHLKLRVAQGGGKPIDAVMWWAGDRVDFFPRGAYVDICFRARLNRYCGREMPQLQLVDIRMSGEGRS